MRCASQLIVGAIGQYLISICPLLSPVRAASDFYMAPRERERGKTPNKWPQLKGSVWLRERVCACRGNSITQIRQMQLCRWVSLMWRSEKADDKQRAHCTLRQFLMSICNVISRCEQIRRVPAGRLIDGHRIEGDVASPLAPKTQMPSQSSR